MMNLENKLQEYGILKIGDFELTKGQKSKYYIDIKRALTKPNLLRLITKNIVQKIESKDIKADYIGCMELGGVPIGVLVSVETGLPLLIVRKEKKEHGLKERIIGDYEEGKILLFVEDVTTTGGSALNAVHVLRDNGMIVNEVISVVDREEGAASSLAKEGLELISIIKASSLFNNMN